MKRNLPICALCSAVLTAAFALPAIAGGGPGDPQSQQESGTHFFGEVKDIGGFKPLEGARVKVAIAGTAMFLVVLTDAEGRFRLEGFGRDVAAAKIKVTCDKDGYRAVETTHRQVGRQAASPIEVECLMASETGRSRP